MLATTLAVANYLNGEGHRGGAWGFKLDSIERIEETKSQDRKENAAFFVVRAVWEKYPCPVFEPEELEQWKVISKVSVAQCQNELNELRKNSFCIEHAIHSQTKDPEDKIRKTLEGVLPTIKKAVERFET